MKPFVFATALLLTAVSTPVLALTVDLSGITPVLTFPEPKEETVTKDVGGIDK